MATKKTRELIQECETQADSLFTSLGRLLYENIQAGSIAYYFVPEDPALTARARQLVRQVVAGKLADRKGKVKVDPRRNVSLKVPARGVDKPKVNKRADVLVIKAPVRAERQAPKNKMVGVLKGVTNVLISEFKGLTAPAANGSAVLEAPHQVPLAPLADRPADSRPVNEPAVTPVSRRGQLEPYTKLIVDLHVSANKMLDIQKDFNDCIASGLLHASGERTAACQAAADKKIQSISLLFGKKREEIKRVMENKRQFFAENPEANFWKPEKDFLERLEQEVKQTTSRMDVLIDEVIALFKSINATFEQDLEETRRARQDEPASAPRAYAPPVETQEEAPVSEEASDAAVEEEEEDGGEAPLEDDSDDTVTSEDELPADYGLLETASRKLSSESTSDDEKLAVLHTLFRNAPKRAVPFLYDLTREADVFFQRKLLALLILLDYPTMVDLYRRFITDENSSLRLQGVMGLVKLRSDEAKHVIVAAIRDHDAHVRRFIVNQLDHTAGEPEATAIARLAADIDEGVARVAIRKLGIMGNHLAFVSLVPRLESLNVKICKEAIEALVRMTGTDLGYNVAASAPERKRQARPWIALAKESYTNPRLLRDLRHEQASAQMANRSNAKSVEKVAARKKAARR